MPRSLDYSLVAASQSSLSDFRRKAALFPATHELRETFALRRILLKCSQRTDEELHVVHKFLSEHTTMWREPFWALLSEKERLDVVDCVKLRMVPRGGESEDFIAADSTSGSMVIVAFRGLIQVRCFDSQDTSLEFQPRETFGFLPVPTVLIEDAERNVEKVKANPRSKIFRGLRGYIERRQTVAEAGKIRVKISCDCEYISIRGADVAPMLQRIAEKHIRARLLTSIGLELPGASGGSGAEGPEKKREMLMREARYSMGSILVEEGAPPTTVSVIIEGECRIVKGKPQSQAAAKTVGKSLRHNLSSSRRGKVDILFTNGFHTQVDACQIGTLGPKALVGDIPALLGGLQPASVVAKTPLRVLQCRADKFSNNLDHNIRARMVYMEAAKARKAWMEERGAEVERLMSLAGTPLLLNVGGNIDITSKRTAKEDLQDVDQSRRHGSSWKSADASPIATSSTRPTDRLRKSRGRELHHTERGALRLNQPDEANGNKEPGMTSKAPEGEIRPSAIFEVKTREPNRERMVATTSSPLLPSCSLGSRVDFRKGQRTHGKTKAGKDRLFGLQSDGVKMSEPASVGELARAMRPKGTVVQEPDDSNRAGRSEGRGSWLTSRNVRGHNEGGEDSLAKSLLASHLEPFPTITRNRCLHAVPQPILPRSEGFVDAFQGDISMLGTAAWRLSRAAKFDDLVSPADRASIVRQIEAGLNALQGRRVSPLA